MKTALVELISKISAGVMGEDEVARITDRSVCADYRKFSHGSKSQGWKIGA